MKTICKNDSTVSLYAFEDNQVLTLTPENTIVGEPVEWIIADCNADNSTVFLMVKLPTDWKPSKYLFNAKSWSKNPDYVEPKTKV
jgi:hypothetical protein